MIVAVAVWSIASGSHALAAGFLGFAAARATLGFGEGATFPGGLRVVTETLPERLRARGVAVAYSGGSLGSVITPLIVTVAAQATGIVVLGAVTLLWPPANLGSAPLLWGVCAGVFGGMGVLALYAALATGRRQHGRHPIAHEDEQNIIDLSTNLCNPVEESPGGCALKKRLCAISHLQSFSHADPPGFDRGPIPVIQRRDGHNVCVYCGNRAAWYCPGFPKATLDLES